MGNTEFLPAILVVKSKGCPIAVKSPVKVGGLGLCRTCNGKRGLKLGEEVKLRAPGEGKYIVLSIQYIDDRE